MYARQQSQERRADVLAAAIRDIQFATVVTTVDGAYHASHLPMVLKAADGGWLLEGHVARPNRHWAALDIPRASVAIFQGPQAYVSPSWYPAKQAHGRVVPTWAYVAVHAHGALEMVADTAWLMAHLADLTTANEAGQKQPWAMADAPADYIPALARGVVGLRLHVDRLEGAWKLNQHRSAADQLGMAEGLEAAGGAGATAIAGLVRAELDRQGDGGWTDPAAG